LRGHLNNDHLDALLGPLGGVISENSSEVRDEAQLHLESCESCQETVRAQKRAMDQLAFLKVNEPELPGPDCPDEEVWVEIAAGNEPAD